MRKGFTLIELLVVIAIIGLLASVVLASLGSARAKGADATIKGNLNNARVQAALYYDNNTDSYGTSGYPNTGTGVCYNATAQSSTIYQMVLAADTANGTGSADCDSGGSEWAAHAQLVASADYYCVDSAGTAKILASPGKAPSATACP